MIRPGRDEDAAGFIALIAACWGEYPGVSTDVVGEAPEIRALATYMAGCGGAVWTAEDGGTVVGMVATYPAREGWHLSRMYVAASQRGTGLGRDLLRTAEDYARAAGASRMTLWSDVKFARAHAFYENHSYLRHGGLRALHDVSDTMEAGYAKPLSGRVVQELDVAAAGSAERPLGAMLAACAAFGAATPFLPPLDPRRARGYWRGVAQAVGQGRTRLFGGWRNGVLAGALQLVPDPAESGRHRAELRHLLIAPGSRCRGVARRLLATAEAAAWADGRTLLLFPTRVDEHAEPYYREDGWIEAGTLPGYAPDGAAERIYVKQAAAGAKL